MRYLLPLILLAAGCVWAQPLPDAVIADLCSQCEDTQACNEDGECEFSCSDSEYFPAACVDPARICFSGDCVYPCVDDECPGGLRCQEESFYNECKTSCYEDSDCRANFRCCEPFSGEDCDIFECVRR